ncbi:hypothetical protein SAMN05421858_0348 [Haladaptatus litoreus]|uniref:DUF7344 domain-containing protein n=1 Tax=Haladaptatus litoreus TaxID=553468 RepID=A0A1N6VGL5_9EURY|nr:hypothetical protein [Haladaptatus litoreus]SIQ76937.1 hypothetical protein SAMN05421858_0348 [Haladaptatus litoreus]
MTDSNPTKSAEQSTRSAREVSQLFDSMKRPERRSVLLYLHESDSEKIDVDELCEHVSNQVAKDETTVRRLLYHWHLPKLADLDCVRYDTERGVVSSLPRAAEFLDRFGE